jgi:hypothetical protein
LKRQENEPEAILPYRLTANRCRPQDVPLREDDIEATLMKNHDDASLSSSKKAPAKGALVSTEYPADTDERS